MVVASWRSRRGHRRRPDGRWQVLWQGAPKVLRHSLQTISRQVYSRLKLFEPSYVLYLDIDRFRFDQGM